MRVIVKLLTRVSTHRAIGVALQNRRMTSRLSQITYSDLAPEVRPLADEILKVSSAGLAGPYNALLRSPELGRRFIDFFDYLRFRTSVDRRLNEFAILIQGRIANAQYEWWAHEPIARRAGLSDAVIRELQQCRRPLAMQEDERLVYDYCVQLTFNHRVPDALWREAVEAMGEQAVIDLTALAGAYGMVCMLLNAIEVGLPGGTAAPLEVFDPIEIRRRLLA